MRGGGSQHDEHEHLGIFGHADCQKETLHVRLPLAFRVVLLVLKGVCLGFAGLMPGNKTQDYLDKGVKPLPLSGRSAAARTTCHKTNQAFRLSLSPSPSVSLPRSKSLLNPSLFPLKRLLGTL